MWLKHIAAPYTFAVVLAILGALAGRLLGQPLALAIGFPEYAWVAALLGAATAGVAGTLIPVVLWSSEADLEWIAERGRLEQAVRRREKQLREEPRFKDEWPYS